MRLKEVAKRLKVSASTIRQLERTGQIAAPERDRNDHRRYSEKDVEEIRRVIYAKKTGDLVPGAPAAQRTDKVNELIERLQRGRAERAAERLRLRPR